jgi:hypothetical protein
LTSIAYLSLVGFDMKSPKPLFTGHEAARALEVNQVRFSRAVRKRAIIPDFIANGARGIDLFLPASVRALRVRKQDLFP